MAVNCSSRQSLLNFWLIAKKVNTRVNNVKTIEQEQDLSEDNCGGISKENDSFSIKEQTKINVNCHQYRGQVTDIEFCEDNSGGSFLIT